MEIPLTQKRLKEVLYYDPETGVFTRIVRTSNSINIGDVAGGLMKIGYLRTSIDGKSYLCHRLAFLYMLGEFPPMDTDHINGVKHDNRWENLRSVSHKDNTKNQRLRKSSKSGSIGVYWREDTRKWSVRICAKGKLISLGCFSEFDDAVTARKVAHNKYGYHENHGGR